MDLRHRAIILIMSNSSGFQVLYYDIKITFAISLSAEIPTF